MARTTHPFLDNLPPTHPAMTTPVIWHPTAPRIGTPGDGTFPTRADMPGAVTLLFRRIVENQTDRPVTVPIHVSASQRFVLHLDGAPMAWGPCRAHVNAWGVVALQLFIPPGRHALSARVVHWGAAAGKAQLGNKGFFLLATADDTWREALATGPGWRVARECSRLPQTRATGPKLRGHRSVWASEIFDAARHPWGWTQPDFDDSDWTQAKPILDQVANRWGNRHLDHHLRVDPLRAELYPASDLSLRGLDQLPHDGQAQASQATAPPILGAEVVHPFGSLPLADEATQRAATGFVQEGAAWTIPPRTALRAIFDRGYITNEVPCLEWSGGQGATVRLIPTEAPLDPATGQKGNRHEIEGKGFPGVFDEIHPDDGEGRFWYPLWFRSFRYLVMEIRTGDQPLTLHELFMTFTGYGFPQSARGDGGAKCDGRDRREAYGPGDEAEVEVPGIDAQARSPYALCVKPSAPTSPGGPNQRGGADPKQDGLSALPWEEIDRVNWRTARLCAHETLFDCPHYEQGQFPGDSRIQALYHYLAAGDGGLIRKAIDDCHASRQPNGLLLSHYPATFHQILPTYSLQWLGMLYDYLLYRGEPDFLAPYLPTARGVLDWFLRLRDQRGDGLPGLVPFPPFLDWSPAFDAGQAPQDADGGSIAVAGMMAGACRQLARLEEVCGFAELAPRWRREAEALGGAMRATAWDAEAGRFFDTPARVGCSVHAQTEAILGGVLEGETARTALRATLGTDEVIQPHSLYYRAFVGEALRRCGLGARILDFLRPWGAMLRGTGLTTWPENPTHPRSDCHAWSLYPGIALPRDILGLRPAEDAIGFDPALLAPNLGGPGGPGRIRGAVPTPHGPIRIDLARAGSSGWRARIESPIPVTVPTLAQTLPPGAHTIEAPG